MRTTQILATAALALAAASAGAFSDSGRFVHRGCGGYNPVITVSPTCTYQTGTCSVSWASDANFYMRILIVKEEGSTWNNLVPANSDAVPQAGTYCTDAYGRYCYRLQLSNVTHVAMGDGAFTEVIPAGNEQTDNLVEYLGSGGINFGQPFDVVTFKVAQSNTGRPIVHMIYECDYSDHTELHDVEFQIQLTGWFPHA